MDHALTDGVVLAATILEDRGAARARSALAPPLARAVDDEATRLDGLDEEERQAHLRAVTARLAPPVDAVALPPRARALLAGQVPRETGRAFLAAAPPPRRGFRSDAGLTATLRRIAGERPAAERAEAELRELEEAEAWRA